MNTMPILVPAVLLLAACTPTATDVASTSTTPVAEASPATAPTPSQLPSTAVRAEPASTQSTEVPAAESTGASISGGIRDGNRPPPALRVCATPVNGGTPTCINTAEGAREYRVEVAPGRYYLLGWAQSGELTLIAHASQIRCIRAPCPPDELIEVTVATGQQRAGIDLNGGYADVPDGWPKQAN
ncbi:hypothetical protein [Thermomonas sp.]|uniref:hypothetical protein n=1 Tax=Thermomonas sp. TaxID=1971895 RepID=UPI00248A469F|nr:hypothetical protein [Thermomonas sp.]MDI1252250.1 hypothetical protein [Thermomonas sp.]